MTKFYLYPYKLGSRSAKGLADGLDTVQIKPKGSKYRPRKGHKVINWGASEGHVSPEYLVNTYEAVAVCANKLTFFQTVSDRCNVVPFTPNKQTAKKWLDEDMKPIMARQRLTGHSGQGIIYCEPGVDIPDAPLYTKYIPKMEEYRVHIFNGQVLDVQRKIKRPDVDKADVDWRVRSHENGFIYIRNDINPDKKVLAQAKDAVRAVPGLEFGAVDVIWNEKRGEAFVLEINTAPGLTGTTLTNYVNMFKEAYAT